MATLRENALAYEAPHTKNIADLDTVSVNLEVEDRKGVDKEGKEFEYKVVEVEGQEYRIPKSVLKSLKAIVEANPTVQRVKVVKQGTGMETVYVVIPVPNEVGGNPSSISPSELNKSPTIEFNGKLGDTYRTADNIKPSDTVFPVTEKQKAYKRMMHKFHALEDKRALGMYTEEQYKQEINDIHEEYGKVKDE